MAGGGCIGCHSNPDTRYYVNTSLFGEHANVNASGGPNNVTDADCMTCHFGSSNIIMSPDAGLGAANHSNTWFCQDCHTSAGTGPIHPTDANLIKDGLQHGSTNCQWCHIAGDPLARPLINENETLRYHPNGPKGTAAGRNCVTCHYNSNLPDLPFHAPGESHKNKAADCEDSCHGSVGNHLVNPVDAQSPPIISSFSIQSPVISGDPAEIQATYTDSNYLMQIAAAQYQVWNISGIVIDWTNMTAKDGAFNYASEVVNATIDTMES